MNKLICKTNNNEPVFSLGVIIPTNNAYTTHKVYSKDRKKHYPEQLKLQVSLRVKEKKLKKNLELQEKLMQSTNYVNNIAEFWFLCLEKVEILQRTN